MSQGTSVGITRVSGDPAFGGCLCSPNVSHSVERGHDAGEGRARRAAIDEICQLALGLGVPAGAEQQFRLPETVRWIAWCQADCPTNRGKGLRRLIKRGEKIGELRPEYGVLAVLFCETGRGASSLGKTAPPALLRAERDQLHLSRRLRGSAGRNSSFCTSGAACSCLDAGALGLEPSARANSSSARRSSPTRR